MPGAANGSPDKFARLQVEGYVNQSGLITTIPSNIPEGMLVPYSDKAGTRRALKSEEINSYHVIPADYVEKGELIYINPDLSWVHGFRRHVWNCRPLIA